MKEGKVVHLLPGRVRIRLEPGDLDDRFGDQVRTALSNLAGVDEVRLAPRTGSILVLYNPDQLDLVRLDRAARRARLMRLVREEREADDSAALPLSETSRQIKRVFRDVNLRLAETTAGRWDLRSVMPAAFGLLAMRQLIRDFGSWGAAPWYVLAWYAFDSFYKLNQQLPDGSALPTASEVRYRPVAEVGEDG